MIGNPFSPIFGGKPEVFFGRDEILSLFDLAMIDPGSDNRALFITGTRGCGKTALLEQLSIRAAGKKRRVFDLGPENTISQFIRELSDFDEITNTISPKANVNVLGFGGGISTGSVSKTRRNKRESLQSLLLESCSKSKNGILVTVDEIQKVPVEDISSICNAFQMASRKGHDIMLAVAGLPYAYKSITRHEGCTYLRRASHEELGLFTWEETDDAFSKIFSRIKGLKINESCLEMMNQASFGHPYLMQLLGYHLILIINTQSNEKNHEVTKNETTSAIKNALVAYEKHALKPLLDELPNNEKKYLIQMSKHLDLDRLAKTADIAQSLGVPQNKTSKTRAYLIDHGIIAAPERGNVMFCIPYLADYVIKDESTARNIEIARERRV
ncbi:MAG: ATP-binding protein [Lachnospiraceae bacterium]|nr:ATP-binding protein [Lachnospiraceae bacterium]